MSHASTRMSMGNSSMMLGDNDLELGKSIASSFKSSQSPLERSRTNTVDNKKKREIRLKRKAWYRRHDSVLCKLK